MPKPRGGAGAGSPIGLSIVETKLESLFCNRCRYTALMRIHFNFPTETKSGGMYSWTKHIE